MLENQMIWAAPRMWDGGRCFIIGGGPSMPRQFGIPEDIIAKVRTGELSPAVYSPHLSPIHAEHVIGINNAYQLGTWLDVLFFGDCNWYLTHRILLSPWPKLKVTCCPRFANKSRESAEGVKYLAKDGSHRLGMTTNRNRVSWNFNSGFAAINMAVHFGVKTVILLGFDMAMEGKSAHWHRGHGGKNPPPFKRHMKGCRAIVDEAAALGVEILNVSPDSAITEFRKVELKDVL